MSEKVKVYTTDVCPWCVKVKEHLTKNGIKFEVKNISTEQELAQDVINISGQMSVPLTVLEKKYVVGFNPKGLNELTGKK